MDELNLDSCAMEPIRVPGAIQPQGRMLVVDAHSRAIQAYSANWPSLSERLTAMSQVRPNLFELPLGDAPAAIGQASVGGKDLDVSAHRLGAQVIVEFENRSSDSGTQAPIYSLARHFLPQLQGGRSVEELLKVAVKELKRLTGFGRCLAYRFDDDGHGEVLASSAEDGYDDYENHRFPASDIPAQARELYKLNYIRLIPDAMYDAVPLLSDDPKVAPTSIDLSLAGLRSVSPVHLEYMRNMGTRASLSVSIVVGDHLWGLVSCHDRDPKFLPFHTRAACEHLGRLLSIQVEGAEDRFEIQERQQLQRLTLEIIAPRADLDASLFGLIHEPAQMLRLTRAEGLAIVLDDVCQSYGEVPPDNEIIELANWLTHTNEPLFQSSHMEQEFALASRWGRVGAGVLAISISQVHRHFIIWFRTSVTQTITWAGRPYKEVQQDGRIQPRHSFASWTEELVGRSAKWSNAQQAAALDLRQSLLGIVLRRAEELNEVATELGRVNKELEAFSYTVSHDLRAPMRHITGYVDLVLENKDDRLTEKSRRYLKHVKDASSYSGQLVDALLDFSRLGRSAIKPAFVKAARLCQEIAKELTRLEPNRAFEWDIDAGLPDLWGDPVLLQVALRNLLGNAVKYSRETDVTRISVRPATRSQMVGLEIGDNGVGFDMRYVSKLFGVFQRLHQAEQFEGTGIGLASVRRIVERHQGEIWANSSPGQGAQFGFVLPPAEGK